ncbi:cytochrome c oxidase subunit VA-domain-containing protein [Cladochytrium replicatum]|nr:cytochrome c oxidase subunit VA-domain-containing protein [Cladochytrium replicatum]
MIFRTALRAASRSLPSAVSPSLLRLARPAVSAFQLSARRTYASHELDPADSKDYAKYVDKWVSHFRTVEDDFELERGLNHIFSADWVPATAVIEEAVKASRRLNDFATAVRVVEALEEKCQSEKVFQQYIAELRPLLEELGVPERKKLGDFKVARDDRSWTADF